MSERSIRYATKWQGLNTEWRSVSVAKPVEAGDGWICKLSIDGSIKVVGATAEEARRNAEKLMESLAEMTAAAEEREEA